MLADIVCASDGQWSISMRKLLSLTGVFLAAVLCTHVIASVLATQHVLGRLADMGLGVTPSVRFSSTVHDIIGLGSSYLPLIAIGFLIAFFVAALISRRLPGARVALYVAAGAVAVVAVNLSLSAAFDIIPIASARTTTGLLGQGLAGAFGGLLFSSSVKLARR